MTVFCRRSNKPELRGDADISDAIGVRDLAWRAGNVQKGFKKLVVINPGGIQYRHTQGHAPARIELVSDPDIKQINRIYDLCALLLALDLFGRSYEMTMGVLLTISGRHRPVMEGERPSLVEIIFPGCRFVVGCAAQRANHGRARPRRHSTLPGRWSTTKKQYSDHEQEQR